MRKIFLVFVSILLVFGYTSCYASTFSDIVGDNSIYEESVDALCELGIVAEYADGTFQPEKQISRAELTKLLVISVGLGAEADVSNGNTSYVDVASNHWASGYINVATNHGFAYPYSGDIVYGPDEYATVSDALIMALRALGYQTVIESKGSIPSNYYAKALDLKLSDEVAYNSYEDILNRGAASQIVWNMLRIKKYRYWSTRKYNS